MRVKGKSESSPEREPRVNLNEMELVDFEWASNAGSFMYIPTIDKESRYLIEEAQFYNFDLVDRCLESLDVENTKYTPKLAKDIKELLFEFGVDEN